MDETADLTESYLIGNRLVKFLSTVLPTHDQYFSEDPKLVQMKNKSQSQLVELLQYLEQLARIIDEDELNRYILKDLRQPGSKKDTASPRTPARVRASPSDESSFGSPPKMSAVISKTKAATDKEDAVAPSGSGGLDEGFTLTGSPISHRSPHLLELDSTMSSSEESPSRSGENSPLDDGNTTIETTLSFKMAQTEAKVIDQQGFLGQDSKVRMLQKQEASAWDDTFSQYGGDSQTSGPTKLRNGDVIDRVPPPIQEDVIKAEDSRDVSFSDLAGHAHTFDENKVLTEDLFALRNEYESSGGQSQSNSDADAFPVSGLGSEWSPTTKLDFSSVKEKTPPPKRRPRKEPLPRVDLSLYSQPLRETPPKRLTDNSVTRENSPKSVVELEEWKADADEEKEALQALFSDLSRPADFDSASFATNEAEEASLSSSNHEKHRGRNRLRHFKGCVRCLLE